MADHVLILSSFDLVPTALSVNHKEVRTLVDFNASSSNLVLYIYKSKTKKNKQATKKTNNMHNKAKLLLKQSNTLCTYSSCVCKSTQTCSHSSCLRIFEETVIFHQVNRNAVKQAQNKLNSEQVGETQTFSQSAQLQHNFT